MPYLSVKVGANLTTEIATRIADTLADLTVTVLGKRRELTSIALEGVHESHWFVGGEAVDSQHRKTVFLKIHITEGSNTQDEKAAYIRLAFAALQSILGSLHPASYIVIEEVAADAWGYEGVTQAFRHREVKAAPVNGAGAVV